MPKHKSFAASIVSGGAWMFGLKVFDKILGLLRIVLLARLLTPGDFGVWGVALLVLAMLETFSQTGFEQALIQKKEGIRPYLDTAWTVGILRGVLVGGLLFFLSSPAARFFSAPEAAGAIRVLAFAQILRGFKNIGVVTFRKEMEFHKEFVFNFVPMAADVIVAVASAFLLRNVWALVFGLLARHLVEVTISFFMHPYRPRLAIDGRKAKGLFQFGRWILGTSILLFLVNNGDDIFVGRLLGVAMLGLYQMAFKFASLPATEITHVVSQVAFPAYAKVQQSAFEIKQLYLKILCVTTFVAFPIAALIFVLAPELTAVVLGEKWLPMVPALQVMCIFGAARSLGAANGPFFNGTGHPQYGTVLGVIKLVLLGILIYPLTVRWGIVGAAWATTLPSFVSQSCGALFVRKILKCSLRQILLPVIVSLAGVVLMAGVLTAMPVLPLPALLGLVTKIVVGAAVYLAFAAVLNRYYKEYPALSLLKRVMGHLRG